MINLIDQMAGLAFLSNASLAKIRLALLAALMIFSLFVISGVGTMTSNDGVCPLFTGKHWSKGVCDFAIIVAVFLQLVYCGLRLIPAVLLFIGKLRTDALFFSYGAQRCYILGELNFTIVVFVTAALLSSGISATCSTTGIDCNQISWYPAVQVAQAGAWLSSMLFVPLLVVDIVALQRMTDMEMTSEPARVVYTATEPSNGQIESISTQGFCNPVQNVYSSPTQNIQPNPIQNNLANPIQNNPSNPIQNNPSNPI